MSTYKFIKVVRECGHNYQVQAEGRPTRELIYDYFVERDGEHIAVFSRVYSGKGYELHDRTGRQIKDPSVTWRFYPIKVGSQAEFGAALIQYADIIPTAAQIAERTVAEEQERKDLEAGRTAEQRQYRIEKLGPELLDALKTVVRLAAPSCPTEMWTVVDTAIAKAEGQS